MDGCSFTGPFTAGLLLIAPILIKISLAIDRDFNVRASHYLRGVHISLGLLNRECPGGKSRLLLQRRNNLFDCTENRYATRMDDLKRAQWPPEMIQL
jgi:hypothetical protein